MEQKSYLELLIQWWIQDFQKGGEGGGGGIKV